jgi:hypothetical protein
MGCKLTLMLAEPGIVADAKAPRSVNLKQRKAEGELISWDVDWLCLQS